MDHEARQELRKVEGRRDFLRKSAVGAGILALSASLGYGSGYSAAAGLSGNTRTVITDSEVAARVIGGVRIATEFIPDPVPAGTDADPYPGSAIQAALNDGPHVYIPAGTWRLTSTISRAIDGATILGAGRSTKLVFDGLSPCISAGPRNGWLIANLAVDGGGVDVGSASETRFSEVWINGVLTDNRPTATGGGGTGGFYGVRAADFITTGNGTTSNPYNASAIEAAINALPPQGGLVFIRSGCYSGNRINLGRTGEAGRAKSIILRGESADLSGLNGGNYTAVGGDDLFGTWLRCGFRVNTYGCQVAFQNLVLSPPTTGGATILFEGKINDEAITANNMLPTGGFSIQDVKFIGGDPAIHVKPELATMSDVQNWNVLIERIHIREAARGIKIEDTTTYNGIFRGNVEHAIIQGCSGRAIELDIANLKGFWRDILIEDCGSGSTPTVSFRTARAGPGFEINSLDFGDFCNSTVDAYFECYLDGQMRVRNCHFGHQFVDGNRSIQLRGSVDIEAEAWRPGQTITVLQADRVIIRKRGGSAGSIFQLGPIANPENVRIELSPGVIAGVGGLERIGLYDGTSGNRGVLKMWDAATGTYRYAYIDNGAWVISSTEPT